IWAERNAGTTIDPEISVNEAWKIYTGRKRKGSFPLRKNPSSISLNRPTQIYGETHKIQMRKTAGDIKGPGGTFFEHDFKKGVKQTGLPAGTIIKCPGGQSFKLSTRCVILHGSKHLWGLFQN